MAEGLSVVAGRRHHDRRLPLSQHDHLPYLSIYEEKLPRTRVMFTDDKVEDVLHLESFCCFSMAATTGYF